MGAVLQALQPKEQCGFSPLGFTLSLLNDEAQKRKCCHDVGKEGAGIAGSGQHAGATQGAWLASPSTGCVQQGWDGSRGCTMGCRGYKPHSLLLKPVAAQVSNVLRKASSRYKVGHGAAGGWGSCWAWWGRVVPLVTATLSTPCLSPLFPIIQSDPWVLARS